MSRNRFDTYQNGLFEILDRVAPYFILNIAWFIMSLPLVTLIPVTGGLYYATHLLARDGDATLGDLWRGIRLYFWKSWWWAAVNILAYGLVAVNFLFYGGFETAWSVWIRIVILIVGFFWTCLQLYTFPMLIEQEDKRIRVALRNSYVAFVFRPLQTMGWAILIIFIAGLSTLYAQPSWIIITAALCLSISNRVTRRTLDSLRPELIDDDVPVEDAE